jgi:hypothetical protein
MKLILENWRKFLSEQETQIQIYCDMDGVLVNFEKGAIDYINEDLKDETRIPEKFLKRYRKLQDKLNELGRDQEVELMDISKDPERRVKAARNYMYERIQDDYEFWSGLEWMPDGKQLWDYIKGMTPQIIILTSPMQGNGSHEGKKEWVKRELGSYQVILEENKWKHSGPNKLLIDDLLKNIKLWVEYGGLVIHHQNASDSITELKEKLSETHT